MSSLGTQDWLRGRRRLDVVVVLNNCTDRSSDVLQEAARRYPALRLHVVEVDLDSPVAHVGTARRLALDTALALEADPARLVLLSTDADAAPAPDWVSANLEAVAAGADLVGGLVIKDREEELALGPGFMQRVRLHATYESLSDRLAHLIDPQPHDAWPRHGNHVGASLAVRGEVYAAVGGLPALPSQEDIAFVSRVRAAGYRVRHALEARVTVSARLDGRAEGGMAACHRAWVRDAAEFRPLMVEAADAVCERLRLRRQLRECGHAERLDPRRMAGLPSLAPGEGPESRTSLPPPALIEILTTEMGQHRRLEPAERAIARLQDLIAAHESQARAA